MDAYLGCLVVDNLLCCQVTLVTDKQLVDILIGISINLIEPLLDVVEAVLICHIINHLRTGNSSTQHFALLQSGRSGLTILHTASLTGVVLQLSIKRTGKNRTMMP